MDRVEKAPAMPFYGKDIYTDERTLRLSYAHQGLYVRLLWWQWSEGSIPAAIDEIADMIGKARDTRHLFPGVAQFFEAHPDLKGRLWNLRLEDARRKLMNHRHGGPKAAEARRQKSGVIAGEKREQEPPHNAAEDAPRAADPLHLPLLLQLPLKPTNTKSLPRGRFSRRSKSGRNNGETAGRRDERLPLWSQKQFQFKADTIARWIEAAKRRGIGPGEEDFDAEFLEKFSMEFEYWLAERDRHLRFFSTGEGAA